MAFPKTPVAGVNGLSQAAGNAIAEDEKSNINWQKSSQRIGTTNGRVKFGKQSISSLNKGVGTCRDDDAY
jgi:hypothetical protein